MALTCTLSAVTWAAGSESYVSSKKGKGFFPLAVSGKNAPLVVNSSDWPGVLRIADSFRTDIGMVTGIEPELHRNTPPREKSIVVIGTIGKSPLIDSLISGKKLDVTGIAGKSETFLLQIVEKPFSGVDQALVIAGSDKRGTIYGMFDLSAEIGVSPWYWWADVPAHKQESYISCRAVIPMASRKCDTGAFFSTMKTPRSAVGPMSGMAQ